MAEFQDEFSTAMQELMQELDQKDLQNVAETGGPSLRPTQKRATAAQTAAEMTGLPSAARGGRNLAKGVINRDVATGAKGLAQVGLALVPVTAAAVKGGNSLINLGLKHGDFAKRQRAATAGHRAAKRRKKSAEREEIRQSQIKARRGSIGGQTARVNRLNKVRETLNKLQPKEINELDKARKILEKLK